MPIYEYKHPKTNEIFSEIRLIKDRNKPFMSKDGFKCERVLFSIRSKPEGARASRAGMKLESFQLDPEYVKKCNPKFVKFRDGHKERYDPTKHF